MISGGGKNVGFCTGKKIVVLIEHMNSSKINTIDMEWSNIKQMFYSNGTFQ